MPSRTFSLVVLCALPVALGGRPDPPREGLRDAASLKPVTVAVVDAETGKPVTEFSYVAGFIAPGQRSPLRDEWREVVSPSGTFTVPVPGACRLSVLVRSPDVKGLAHQCSGCPDRRHWWASHQCHPEPTQHLTSKGLDTDRRETICDSRNSGPRGNEYS